MTPMVVILALLQESSSELKPRPPSEVLKKAEELIEARETPGSLEQAIALLSPHTNDPDPGLPLLITLAKAQALFVDTCDLGKAGERRKHQEHREAGKVAARQALQIDPQSGPAHYWLGLLLLYSADGEQSYDLLKQAIKQLEFADRRSPDVDDAGPARMLGRIYQQTPGWPLLGSTAKSIQYLEKACTTAPDNLRNSLWLGLSYEAAGRTRRARERLVRVVESKPRGAHEHEEEALKKEAAEHLKRLGS